MMNTRQSQREKKSCQKKSKSVPSRPDTTLGSMNVDKTIEQSWTIQRLTTNYIPNEIVGRDHEKQFISEFVQNCVLNNISAKVLYISGVPGVGKTASTMQVVRRMEWHFKRKLTVGFINALSLRSPNMIYRKLYTILTGNDNRQNFVTLPDRIGKRLGKLQKTHLIVIDEVDFLLTKDQKIFYNLFQWAAQVTSKLAFIIIANTMNFPQKLSPKINSRMGNNRLVFAPYNYDQIRKIIDERLTGCKYFTPPALSFVSKKLSTYSSDMRTILEVLRNAVTEHIQSEKPEKISIEVVQRLWDNKTKANQTKQSEQTPSLYTYIIQQLKRNDNASTSLDLIEVLGQRGISHSSLLVLLKQMAEQGQVILTQTVKGLFTCYKVKLVMQFNS